MFVCLLCEKSTLGPVRIFTKINLIVVHGCVGVEGERGLQGVRDGHPRDSLQRGAQAHRGNNQSINPLPPSQFIISCQTLVKFHLEFQWLPPLASFLFPVRGRNLMAGFMLFDLLYVSSLCPSVVCQSGLCHLGLCSLGNVDGVLCCLGLV